MKTSLKFLLALPVFLTLSGTVTRFAHAETPTVDDTICYSLQSPKSVFQVWTQAHRNHFKIVRPGVRTLSYRGMANRNPWLAGGSDGQAQIWYTGETVNNLAIAWITWQETGKIKKHKIGCDLFN